jgi:peptidoglycan/xylan/chitin deacetylase (PgdA/CDA1 family)
MKLVRKLTVFMCLLVLGACAAARGPAPVAAPRAPAGEAAPPPAASQAGAVRPAPLPEAFESQDFIVTFAKAGDTHQSLAARFLGDPTKAWMLEDYNGPESPAAGREIVIPKRPWNLAGVDRAGHQIVPVLVYHNIAPQAKGRMVVSARAFEEQMRFLKTQGFHVLAVRDFVQFISLDRQIPRKSVVLTFDDGYRSFVQHAYPVLKELGFTATLFVYTDYVGSGRNALSWSELKQLADEGFEIGAHSKSHENLRRRPGETDAGFSRRMQAELSQAAFQKNLGMAPRVLAFPYGAADPDVLVRVRDQGYVAAFTVHREGNPSFGPPLVLGRSQIYGEMSLNEFTKNLATFAPETLN